MNPKKELIINPLISQKESELKLLEKMHQHLQKKLETEKTKLQSLKDEMIHTQRQAFSLVTARMDKVKQLQAELKQLFEIAGKSKLFNKQEKKTLKEMAKELDSDMFGHRPGDFASRPIDGEEQEARSANFFKEFSIAPAQEESQNIRKLFLKLATRFHPDKATHDKEAAELHTLMQRINEAYKAGDIAELLAIEEQYLSRETVSAGDENSLADFLERRINRLTSDISLLEDQMWRVKEEIKNINRSDAGKIHKQMRKNASPMDYITQDMDQMIGALTQLRDGLKEFLDTGIMPASLAREFQPDPFTEIELDEVLSFLFEIETQQSRKLKASRKKAKKKVVKKK